MRRKIQLLTTTYFVLCNCHIMHLTVSHYRYILSIITYLSSVTYEETFKTQASIRFGNNKFPSRTKPRS